MKLSQFIFLCFITYSCHGKKTTIVSKIKNLEVSIDFPLGNIKKDTINQEYSDSIYSFYSFIQDDTIRNISYKFAIVTIPYLDSLELRNMTQSHLESTVNILEGRLVSEDIINNHPEVELNYIILLPEQKFLKGRSFITNNLIIYAHYISPDSSMDSNLFLESMKISSQD